MVVRNIPIDSGYFSDISKSLIVYSDTNYVKEHNSNKTSILTYYPSGCELVKIEGFPFFNKKKQYSIGTVVIPPLSQDARRNFNGIVSMVKRMNKNPSLKKQLEKHIRILWMSLYAQACEVHISDKPSIELDFSVISDNSYLSDTWKDLRRQNLEFDYKLTHEKLSRIIYADKYIYENLYNINCTRADKIVVKNNVPKEDTLKHMGVLRRKLFEYVDSLICELKKSEKEYENMIENAVDHAGLKQRNNGKKYQGNKRSIGQDKIYRDG